MTALALVYPTEGEYLVLTRPGKSKQHSYTQPQLVNNEARTSLTSSKE